MNRREALSSVALLLGGTIVGTEFFLSGCKPERKYGESLNLSPDDISFLDEVGETILPTTASSPGAKATKIGEFMKTIVNDCYEDKDQKTFLEGMQKLNDACKTKNGKMFLDCDDKQRHDFLVDLDKEQKEYMNKKKPEDPSHYFRMMKELTLWGYFTSEIGATKALRYIAVPGKYEGCVPYKKGDKAWAT
ncbi:MAG: gluconate 2-dehydrogenase subunit 3 family protein [Bacteroidetes bacterium]|nr:gluconate 2-dehydrogenase subunit 3 family protein [Bacteroidota bacterium]MBS1974555.1 gluconate 2-dehydrogenase subunit 3 family protein [Bacteroidota bacterium]